MDSDNKNIDLNDLLSMMGNEENFENESEAFIEEQTKFCSAIGYLTTNISNLNDRQLRLTLSAAKKFLDSSVNASYTLIKAIEKKYPDVSFSKFINDEY